MLKNMTENFKFFHLTLYSNSKEVEINFNGFFPIVKKSRFVKILKIVLVFSKHL
jgi:hypothetical protein